MPTIVEKLLAERIRAGLETQREGRLRLASSAPMAGERYLAHVEPVSPERHDVGAMVGAAFVAFAATAREALAAGEPLTAEDLMEAAEATAMALRQKQN